jgi:Na+/H+-dicarboxylate symporter
MLIAGQFNVPADGIALILGVDRLMDMGRTVPNVVGDLACAVYVDRSVAKNASSATGR